MPQAPLRGEGGPPRKAMAVAGLKAPVKGPGGGADFAKKTGTGPNITKSHSTLAKRTFSHTPLFSGAFRN